MVNNKRYIESVIDDLKKGRMIILTDDQDRENEADLVIAAEHTTPDAINFMARCGRGLICLAMAPTLTDQLQLPLMTTNNSAHLKTNFTVSIDAKEGIHTGISAFDRAKTIRDTIKDNASFCDFVIPGHIFPLKAHPSGVLKRRGQTEGSVDLMNLAQLKPAAVICEMMHEDGHMLQGDDIKRFAGQHQLKILSIQDLVQYRLNHDTTIITKITETQIPTKWKRFRLIAYQTQHDQLTHLAYFMVMLPKDLHWLEYTASV